MTGILKLPGELVDNIAFRLGSDDKFSLRLTCRELEQKSQRAFGLHHFTKKCVHLTTDSLTVLLNISKSKKLGKYVRDVTLITALFSAADTARLIVPCKCCFAQNPDSHEESSYRFYIEDQSRLRETGEDQALLDEAFRLLPRLNTVALVDSEDRLQPGTDYQGGRKVLRKTGQLRGNRVSTTSVTYQVFRQALKQSLAPTSSDYQQANGVFCQTNLWITSTICGILRGKPYNTVALFERSRLTVPPTRILSLLTISGSRLASVKGSRQCSAI